MKRKISNIQERKRIGRHTRIRKVIQGTAERPRLCVHRSLKNLYAQIVDDTSGKVLFGLSTLNKGIKGKVKNGCSVEGATGLGAAVAEAAKSRGISRVCFDRGGYLYHGRIKAFAEAAREQGLEF